jgi:hypothetical protein
MSYRRFIVKRTIKVIYISNYWNILPDFYGWSLQFNALELTYFILKSWSSRIYYYTTITTTKIIIIFTLYHHAHHHFHHDPDHFAICKPCA